MRSTLSALALVVLAQAACSPAYVVRSAAGHARLTWNRRDLRKAPPELEAKAALALEARRHGLSLGLSPTRDYLTWSPIEGEAVTWLVYACPKDRLEPHRFRFPLIGSFPYKGHFRKEHADAEAARFERKGYDAAVVPVTAYNTPLWWGDPLPSSALRWPDGELVELVLHELVHGTVYFRGQGEFNEAVASWMSAKAVEGFLTGAALAEWKAGQDRSEKRARIMDDLKARLEKLYAEGRAAERETAFVWAREEAARQGLRLREPLNNAVVAAHSVYRGDPSLFDALFERNGRDWKRTIAALKALDRKDPWGALRRAAAST